MSWNTTISLVPSLRNICIDFVGNNLPCLLNQINTIARLPHHIKDRILHKISVSLHFWKELDAKLVWKCLVHRYTKEVNLTFSIVDDELLSVLKICRNLRELYITQMLDNNFTAQGLLELIPYLTELRILTLSRCTVVNEDVIISIAEHCPKLTSLDLHSCVDITDAALYKLARLKHLSWITLSNTKVSDNGLEALVKGPSGRNLIEFRVADCPNVTGNILPVIIANCPKLEVFVFHGCKMIQDTQLLDLPFKGLKQIQYFSDTQLLDLPFKGLKQIQYTIEW
ncbi:Leucine rich repeat [Popillia japonica]|uniref:Leucine rich repeat n=1 Tax=Popillia japonica TaxID=7064 RepID=A0AAW1HYT1_POPJA